MAVRIINADVLDGLRELPDESVQCCVTSPPYYGLRDYCTGTWEGGDPACDHVELAVGMSEKNTLGKIPGYREKLPSDNAANVARVRKFRDVCGHCGATRIDKQIGLESTPQAYVSRMVEVFREVRRVLRKDGVCFVNIGDSYASTPSGAMRSSGLWGGKANQQSFRLATAAKSIPDGLKPKDLIGIPWRLAFALQDDGWYLRGDYIWHKPNPMPESVTDRCTKAHEYIFHLTKSERYFWDQEAIKEMATYGEPNSPQSIASPYGQGFTRNAIGAKGNANGFRGGAYCNGSTFDNAEGGKRTTRGNRKAGNKSYKYVDQYEIDGSEQHRTKAGLMKVADVEWMGRNKRSVWTMATTPFPEAHFATFPPELPETCIKAGSKPGDTILDPFGGAGTTGLVADRLQRNAVLIELNADYAAMAERRIDKDRGGLLDIMETQSS